MSPHQSQAVLVSLHEGHHNKTPGDQFAQVNASSRWSAAAITIDELVDHILAGKAWMACQSTDGGHSASSAGPSNLIVLDVDGDLPLAQFWAHPFAQRHCVFTYTSCSHGDTAKQEADGTPSSDRFRAIFCCEEHDDGALHRAIYAQVIERLGLQLRDHCGRKSERLWYGNDKAEVRFGGGEPLVWDLIELARDEVAAAAKAQAERNLGRQVDALSNDDSIDNQRAAHVLLHLLNPSEEGGYNYWVKVLNAAASSQDEQVRQAFMDWHARGFHAVGRKGKPPQANVEKKYEKAGRRSTVGVILQLAKEQHGSDWWRQLPEHLWYGTKPAAAPVVLMRSRGPIETIGDPSSFLLGPSAAVPAAAADEAVTPDVVSANALERKHRNLMTQSPPADPQQVAAARPQADDIERLLWRIYRLSVEFIHETDQGDVLVPEEYAETLLDRYRNELFAYQVYAREPWRIDQWLLRTFSRHHGLVRRTKQNRKVFALSDLVGTHTVEFLIPDFIAKGRDYVLFGKQGAGKTTIALALARAIIGDPKHPQFLDAPPVPADVYRTRRVLYIASDGALYASEDLLKYAVWHDFIGTEWEKNYLSVQGQTRFNSETSWAMGLYDMHELAQRLDAAEAEGLPYVAIIVDSLKAVCPDGVRVGDQIITEYIKLMNAVTGPRGVTTIYVHHEAKDSSNGGNAQGAAGILEVVSGVFHVRKDESGQHIFSIQKTRVDPQGNRDIPYTLREGQLSIASPSSGFEDEVDDGRKVLLDVMEEHYSRHVRQVTPLSRTDSSRQYTGISNEQLFRALRSSGRNHPQLNSQFSVKNLTNKLAKEGLIVPVNRSRRGWRLPHTPLFVEAAEERWG